MNRPLPHQLIQVPPAYALSPPYAPRPRPTPRSTELPSAPRRRRLRPPRILADVAFWTGALTALSVAGLLAVIVAAS